MDEYICENCGLPILKDDIKIAVENSKYIHDYCKNEYKGKCNG